MARAAPTPGQKLSFIFFIILGSLFLYIDITSNNFQSIKNGFKSFKISSFYIAKEISIEPLKSIVNLSKSKIKLVEKLHLRDFVNGIDGIADHAEDVADRLSIYAIKRLT